LDAVLLLDNFHMETEEILHQMRSCPSEQTNWALLPVMYAKALSDVSHKLSEEDLYRLISIGKAVYNAGDQHLAHTATTNLLEKVRKG
jgi:hypothetical protein